MYGMRAVVEPNRRFSASTKLTRILTSTAARSDASFLEHDAVADVAAARARRPDRPAALQHGDPPRDDVPHDDQRPCGPPGAAAGGGHRGMPGLRRGGDLELPGRTAGGGAHVGEPLP